MEDKTPIYLVSIVLIVAVVALVYMFSGPSSRASEKYNGPELGSAITGNVVSEDIEPISFKGFGKFLVAVGLVGACIYMYRHE